MTDRVLSGKLRTATQRIKRLRLRTGFGLIWLIVACAGFVLLRFGAGNDVHWWIVGLVLPGVLASCSWAFHVARSTRDLKRVARRIESKFPALDSTLVTAVEQKPADQSGYTFLQEEVLGKAREHSRKHDWRAIVPAWRMVAAGATNVIGLGAAAVVFALLMRMETASASAPEAIRFEDAAIKSAPNYELEVEPGDVSVERGTSLLVIGRFPDDVPESATLLWQGAGDEAGSASMSRSLEDPIFAGRIDSVDGPLTYSIEYADRISDSYQVTVFEYPRLRQADATLRYPEYTKLGDRVVQDVRRLTALRGTQLTLECRLNKPVAKAELVPESGDSIAMEVSAIDAVCRVEMPLLKTETYELRLIDADHRANKSPPKFIFKVTDNVEPKLTMVRPKRDTQVSALEELDLHATVWDDFGVNAAGLSYSLAGGEQHDVQLESSIEARSKTDLVHRISLEALDGEPDQLLSYYFWAEDMGPDGNVRRVLGDMFFAEVRPFEEIFRQGQQQSGQQQQQQGGSAQQAEKLAELQKQIIGATWTVVRREQADAVSDEFLTDVTLLGESQESAIAQLEELASELEDAQSQKFAADAKAAMEAAASDFGNALSEVSAGPLQPALASAQLAYQGLLKLRAREHQVVRARQQSGQVQQQSRSQQQLNELELDEDQNRYEAQSTAQEQHQESAEQREDRQVLNRLRELARRQQDLNERIKELQSALEEAETEAEREEIERQLKRLREEQQQIMRDAEELGQRMEQAENRERMSSERDQLDQARENVRQASEALEEGQVSQAAAEGTRAEEQFRQMKEEFQKRTSGALTEKVRRLQDQAQNLADKEQELAEALEGNQPQQQPTKPSLRSVDRGPDLTQEFEQQRERIGELNEAMKETIQEAEDAEQLLLAEKLYDAIRSTRQRPPQEALTRSELSLRRGLLDEAKQLERIASEGIDKLQDGIDEAAESVLSDDAEALRRARNELQRLKDELSREITRNDPTAPTQENSGGMTENRQPGQQSRQSPQGDAEGNAPTVGQEGSQQDDASPPQNGQRSSKGPSTNGDREGERSEQQPSGEPSRQGQGPRQDSKSQEANEPSSGRGEGMQQGAQRSGEQQGQSQNGEQQNQGGERNGQQAGNAQQSQQATGQQQQGGRGAGGQDGESRRQPSLRSGQRSGEARDAEAESESSSQQPGRQRLGRDSAQRNGGAALPQGDEHISEFMDRTDREPAPLTGDDYLEWSDRLRDVEELLSDPKLRARAAGIRDRAKDVRREVRRHSAEPNWDVVRDMIAEPLAELERQVNAELLRRTADELVPLDRKPIPVEYESAVREYYKRLGAGR